MIRSILKIFILITSVFTLSCGKHNKGVSSCMENSGQGKMFVFIGEKLEVKELNDEKDIMDAKFLAKYKILESICGDYIKDTIEFIVYDHYGRPVFEEFKNVMLYLSEHDGKYYHEKYQYDDLYKTKNGRWASPYDWLEHHDSDTLSNPVKPVKIDYLNEVFYTTAGLKKREIKQRFPEPFYKIVNNKAIAVYGNYIPELFELKKRGVLTARGLFGQPDTSDKIEAQEMTLEEVERVNVSKTESQKLTTAWQQFLNAIEAKDSDKIKTLALPSIICSVCEGFTSSHFYNDIEPIDTFIAASYRNFPGSQIWETIQSGKFKIDVFKYPDRKPAHYNLRNDESLIIYSIYFKMLANLEDSKYQQYHSFDFVKVNGDFKFYGMESN